MLRWIRPEPLIAVVLWSGIFATVKLGLREIPFLSFTELRFILAAVVLGVLAVRGSTFFVPRGHWRTVLASGLAQVSFQGLLFLSLVYTSASNSALLFATTPILLSIGLWIFHGERPSRGSSAGLLLGIAGVALVVRPGGAEEGMNHLLGGVLAIAAAAAWAWYGVAIRPLVQAVGSVPATAWAIALGGVYLLPLAGPEMLAHSWDGVSWVGWGALLYNAILGSVVAMTLWSRSIHRIGAVRTMVYAYMEPVIAVVIAAMLLNERLEPATGMGAVFILLGLWLAR
jgi:drug/metabolite transporter (DMT)-like permease